MSGLMKGIWYAVLFEVLTLGAIGGLLWAIM